MTKTTVRWARIDYQLDLRRPQPPIPLGVIVVAGTADRIHCVLTGRAPRFGGTPPEELKGVGPLGRSQLDGWVASMAKDLMASLEKREDPLDTLASTWCWNLAVVIEPGVEAPRGQTLRDIAARLHARHLGAPAPPAVLAQPAESGAHEDPHWSFTEVAYGAS